MMLSLKPQKSVQLDRAEKNHSQTEEQLANLRQTHSLYKNKVRDVLFFFREKEAVFFFQPRVVVYQFSAFLVVRTQSEPKREKYEQRIKWKQVLIVWSSVTFVQNYKFLLTMATFHILWCGNYLERLIEVHSWESRIRGALKKVVVK